eukprot:3661704-Prymnesium_polylepis.1
MARSERTPHRCAHRLGSPVGHASALLLPRVLRAPILPRRRHRFSVAACPAADGDSSTADFLLKFGHVPRAVMPLDLPNDSVCVRLPATMLPSASDKLRCEALRAAGYDGPM